MIADGLSIRIEIHGTCASCKSAHESGKKGMMYCESMRAGRRGLRSAGEGGGGPVMGYPVHRSFGCIYWREKKVL